MCVFQAQVPDGLGSVLVLVEEQQESVSFNLDGPEVSSYKRHCLIKGTHPQLRFVLMYHGTF